MTDKTMPDEELWICKRKIHIPAHDGATGYFYYEGVEKYVAPAERDGVDVSNIIKPDEVFDLLHGLEWWGNLDYKNGCEYAQNLLLEYRDKLHKIVTLYEQGYLQPQPRVEGDKHEFDMEEALNAAERLKD